MPEGLEILETIGNRTLYKQTSIGYDSVRVTLFWHDETTQRREAAVDIEGPRTNSAGTAHEAKVNWAAHGSVSVLEACEYAALIARAAAIAATLEPVTRPEPTPEPTPKPTPEPTPEPATAVTARLAEMLGGDAEDRAAESTGNEPAPLDGTGRGPTGRLRNFKAMSDAKFTVAYGDVLHEGDDPEAIAAVRAEATRRGWVA